VHGVLQAFLKLDRVFYARFRASAAYQRMCRDVFGLEPPTEGAQSPRAAAASPRRPTPAPANGIAAPATPPRPSSAAAAAPPPRASTAADATPRPPATPARPSAADAAATPRPPLPTRPAGDLAAATPRASVAVLMPQSLAEVLRDPSGIVYFREFMERQRATHLVNFWMAVEGYSSGGARDPHSTPLRTKDGAPADDDATLRQDTAKLYALYFAPEATQPIALPKPLLAGIRAYLENQVRRAAAVGEGVT